LNKQKQYEKLVEELISYSLSEIKEAIAEVRRQQRQRST
jgi:hypothetical protein